MKKLTDNFLTRYLPFCRSSIPTLLGHFVKGPIGSQVIELGLTIAMLKKNTENLEIKQFWICKNHLSIESFLMKSHEFTLSSNDHETASQIIKQSLYVL